MDINYNKWKDEETDIKWQLIFEAERELLKSKKEEKITFYYIGNETVAGLEKGYEAKLKLHPETPPAIQIYSDKGKYVGMIFLKDVDNT